jgi:hypothetical protein
MPKNEIGILNATQKANLMFRNSDKKIKTRKIPIPPFSSKRFVLCLRAIE